MMLICCTPSVLYKYWRRSMPLRTLKSTQRVGSRRLQNVRQSLPMLRHTMPKSNPIDGGTVMASLQDRETGTFAGDEWGEQDTRFLYGALNALSLLGMLHLVDREKIISHIQACANFDGGYGTSPDAESHAGQIFTCVGALAILGRLDLVDKQRLGAWLSERQLPNGGLNGRPEKLEDVCYSWWVASSLAMIGRLHWIDGQKLARFILSCQDSEHGGIADRAGDMVDVFHTVFGIAGLSLIGWEGLEAVDPVYCMPKTVTQKYVGR